jgi:hypothetical protein
VNINLVIMRLQYLVKHQRFDTIFGVSVLNKRVKGPSKKDWGELVRILRYLKGTRDMKLVLRPGDLSMVTGYIDEAIAVHPDMKGICRLCDIVGDCTNICQGERRQDQYKIKYRRGTMWTVIW